MSKAAQDVLKVLISISFDLPTRLGSSYAFHACFSPFEILEDDKVKGSIKVLKQRVLKEIIIFLTREPPPPQSHFQHSSSLNA